MNMTTSQKDITSNTSAESSLELPAPWKLYRTHICKELAKWCQMCDAEQSTITSMKLAYPSVLR